MKKVQDDEDRKEQSGRQVAVDSPDHSQGESESENSSFASCSSVVRLETVQAGTSTWTRVTGSPSAMNVVGLAFPIADSFTLQSPVREGASHDELGSHSESLDQTEASEVCLTFSESINTKAISVFLSGAAALHSGSSRSTGLAGHGGGGYPDSLPDSLPDSDTGYSLGREAEASPFATRARSLTHDEMAPFRWNFGLGIVKEGQQEVSDSSIEEEQLQEDQLQVEQLPENQLKEEQLKEEQVPNQSLDQQEAISHIMDPSESETLKHTWEKDSEALTRSSTESALNRSIDDSSEESGETEVQKFDLFSAVSAIGEQKDGDIISGGPEPDGISRSEQEDDPFKKKKGGSLAGSLYSDRGTASIMSAEKAVNEFLRVSQLARRQEESMLRGGSSDDLDSEAGATVTDDAFRWYLSNGDDFFNEGRLEEAEAEYARALEILWDFATPREEDETRLLSNLGELYLKLEQPERAVALYDRTIQIRPASNISESAYLTALLRAGERSEEGGRLSEAEMHYRKASEVAEGFLEDNDPFIQKINDACMRLARAKLTLVSRFNSNELDELREQLSSSEVSIVHRKARATEEEYIGKLADIWLDRERTKKTEKSDSETKTLGAARAVVVAVGLSLLFVCSYFVFVPVAGLFGTIPGASATGGYLTADGRKSITLTGDGMTTIRDDGHANTMRVAIVKNGWADLLSIFPGSLRAHYQFMNASDFALEGEKGAVLYETGAGEIRLAEHMWKFARLAEFYRNEKRVYPNHVGAFRLAREGARYRNPFTGETMEPELVASTELGFARLTSDIESGRSWPGQSKPKPGLIVCNSFNGKAFYVRGYDRNGRLIKSSEAGKCFAIELVNGVDKTTEKERAASTEVDVSLMPRGDMLVIVHGFPEAQSILFFLNTVLPAVLVLLTVGLWGLVRYKYLKDELNPAYFALAVALSAMTALIYAIGGMNIR